ncbi:MAG: hypothetical protein ACR2OZ_06480 [Verrucomicrobiales bacterium]
MERMRFGGRFCLTLMTLAPGLVFGELRLSTFDIDATPPSGSRLTYDPMKEAGQLTLRCRGLVLQGAKAPIVLCAVDWIGVANEGHDEFRSALAAAAGTTRERVAVQALHQHDAPLCDFSSEKILRAHEQAPVIFDSNYTRPTIERAAAAVKACLERAETVTHAGFGRAEVKEVASARRVLGPDGKIKFMRMTSCKDPKVRAEPEGTIDSNVAVVGFWREDQPLAVLSYYATHPQSYYRTGIANPDFPGIARFLREQAVPTALHIHFTGAGGNIGAGKYNDGAPANRALLAARLADGMQRAWSTIAKFPLADGDVEWRVEPTALPPSPDLDEEKLLGELTGVSEKTASILGSAHRLAWLRRCRSGHRIDLSCLKLKRVSILHMPGELFVEYQLAAQKMRPDRNVAMAAYGDYGPGYIGTEIAYSQGGYETQPTSSFVAPHVEKVLNDAMARLLRD